jgi:hypothetical protein
MATGCRSSASAGLQWDLAVLNLLYDMEFQIERREEASADGVSPSTFRPRPGTPSKPPAPTTTQEDAPSTDDTKRNDR